MNEGGAFPAGDSRSMRSMRAMGTAGFFLVALAPAAAAPELPLRHTALAIPLLLSLPLLRLPLHREALVMILSYTWFWSVLAVTAWGGSSLQAAALGATLIGAALLIPEALAGFRRVPLFSLKLDVGVMAASAVLVVMTGVVGHLFPQEIFFGTGRPLMMIGSCIAVYSALRARVLTGGGRQLGAIAAAGLAAVLVITLTVVALWARAAKEGRQGRSEGRIESAVQWSEIEASRAGKLGLAGAQREALRRKGELHLEGGNREGWLAALAALIAVDPRDRQAHHALFLYFAPLQGEERAALRHFEGIADDMIGDQEARLAAGLSARAGDWTILPRILRASGGESALDEIPGRERESAGRALYFLGETRGAKLLLQPLIEAGDASWETVKTLFFLFLESGRNDEASRLLGEIPPSGNEAEKSYLCALVAQRAGDRKGEITCLREALRLDEGHPSAAARLAELGDSISPPRGRRSDGLIFGKRLRLTEWLIDGAPVLPGEETTLSFRWEAMGPVDPSWRVFVHFRQRVQGGAFFQGDHEFSDVEEGKRGWIVGGALDYDLHVSIPLGTPPGSYVVLAGLWNGRDVIPPAPGRALEGVTRTTSGEIELVAGLEIGFGEAAR